MGAFLEPETVEDTWSHGGPCGHWAAWGCWGTWAWILFPAAFCKPGASEAA